MQTNPEQWAKDLFWAALKAGDHNNYEAAYAVIQAAFAEQNARLVGALQEYRSQFGQALEAHSIPYGDAQQAAEDKARQALAALKDRT